MTGACPMLDTTTRVLREQPCKGHIYTLAGKGIGHDSQTRSEWRWRGPASSFPDCTAGAHPTRDGSRAA